MRECWVIYWREISDGHTAVMTGEGMSPIHPEGIEGDFFEMDLAFADMLLHLYYHEKISEQAAITLARIGYKNGNLGKEGSV